MCVSANVCVCKCECECECVCVCVHARFFESIGYNSHLNHKTANSVLANGNIQENEIMLRGVSVKNFRSKTTKAVFKNLKGAFNPYLRILLVLFEGIGSHCCVKSIWSFLLDVRKTKTLKEKVSAFTQTNLLSLQPNCSAQLMYSSTLFNVPFTVTAAESGSVVPCV